VFTARYALRPYIKQISFVFKGLIHTPLTLQSLGTDSAEKKGEGGSRYILLGTGGPEGRPTSGYAFVFLGSIIICRVYKLTLSDQAQLTLQLTVTLSDLMKKILFSPPLLGGPEKIFSPGPEPAFGGRGY
jgi:hypothetical protein